MLLFITIGVVSLLIILVKFLAKKIKIKTVDDLLYHFSVSYIVVALCILFVDVAYEVSTGFDDRSLLINHFSKVEKYKTELEKAVESLL